MSDPVESWHGGVYATPEFAPFDFELKATADDFAVTELPLYPASGAGDHLLIEIEKRDLTTLQAIGRIARALQRQPREFGHAGLKDRRAVTRQRLSLEHASPDRVCSLELDGIRILSVERHDRKLRRGHLAGNRFELVLRGLARAERERLAACLARLGESGLPNWFGEQRFGLHGNGHVLGRHLLEGDWVEYVVESLATSGLDVPREHLRAAVTEGDGERLGDWARRIDRELAPVVRRLAGGAKPERAVRALSNSVRGLQLSALQSHVFNRLLTRRLSRPEPWRLGPGDVAWIHASGACFSVSGSEPDLAQRTTSFGISPAGPLFGRKLLRAAGTVDAEELEVLREAGLTAEAFAASSARLRGARRPYRVPLRDVELGGTDEAPRLSFSLPPGSYATALVEELRKRIPGRESDGESPRLRA